MKNQAGICLCKMQIQAQYLLIIELYGDFNRAIIEFNPTIQRVVSSTCHDEATKINTLKDS